MKAPFFSTLLFLMMGPCFAQPDEEVLRLMEEESAMNPESIRKYYDACDSGLTMPMMICTRYELTAMELRMNRAYQKVLAAAKKDGIDKSLAESQDAWLKFRHVSCGFEARMDTGGGREEGLFVNSCERELTKQRAERLERHADAQ